MVVIERVRHAQERGEGAHAVAVLVRQLGVAFMVRVGYRLSMIACQIGHDVQLVVAQSEDGRLRDDVVGVAVVPRSADEVPHLVEQGTELQEQAVALPKPVERFQLIEERDRELAHLLGVLRIRLVLAEERHRGVPRLAHLELLHPLRARGARDVDHDSVDQTRERHPYLPGANARGDELEDRSRGHDHVGAIGTEVVLLHSLFG